MTVSSVNPSSSAIDLAKQANDAQNSKHADQVAQTKKQEADKAQITQKAQQQPKPVVNTSGQVTGKVVNTTA